MVISELIVTSCSQKEVSVSQKTSKNLKTTKTSRILISEYDPIMQSAADSVGYDWRWLTAIAYQESRFCNEARSVSGAIGLMQVMPRVARSYGVGADEIVDPATNIRTAVQILRTIETTLRFNEATPHTERLKIILACYNGGIGHIIDARRLAAKHGANYNSWEELSKYVRLKGSPEYVNDEAVRNGSFNGRETVDFVSKVMDKYYQYCKEYKLS